MTRAELNSVRDLHKKICGLEKKLRALKVCADNIVPVLDGLPKSNFIKSRVEKIATAIVETEQELVELRGQLTETKLTLATQIFKETEDAVNQTLLILRYVECLSYKDTAHRMHYTLRQIFRLHNDALKAVIDLHIAT